MATRVVSGPTVSVGTTHLNVPGMERTATGPQLPQVTAMQDKNGNVMLYVAQDMKNPFQPGQMKGIRTNLDITVDQAATNAEIEGSVSRSPAFEVNFAVDSERLSACFDARNVPLQDASRISPLFIWNLRKTNWIDIRTDLP